MSIVDDFQDHCVRYKIPFQIDNSVKAYDDTTLFCPAGMQQFKKQFRDESYKGTKANIQSCIRLDDIALIGDGTHLGLFHMMGTFSFREWSMTNAVDFWMDFLDKLKIKVDLVTIHPDKFYEWSPIVSSYDVNVVPEENCKWTDGQIGGYCMEFFVNGVEIGNIVNPLGTCIDVGFGLERLDTILNGPQPYLLRKQHLENIIRAMVDSGIKSSNKGAGYALRRVCRTFIKEYNTTGDLSREVARILGTPVFRLDAGYALCVLFELERLAKVCSRYNALVEKNPEKSKEWWWDTHGINIDDDLP
jgi:alanyl-tRNA synthetase